MNYSFSKVCSNILPVGNYKMQISDAKFKPNDTTSFNLEVHYVVTDGPYAKRTLIDTIYEKAFSFRLKPFLNAIGADFNREFESAKELYEYGIGTAKGKTLLVEVGVRTYNGNEYNEVKSWSPLPSSTTTAEDVISEFGTFPETVPAKPHVDDLKTDDAEDLTNPFTAEVNLDDFPI